MSDFVDNEAEVASSSGDEDSRAGSDSEAERGGGGGRPNSSSSNRRTPTKKRSKTVISSDEEDDEEEDEEKAREEMRGFIADDDEDGGGRSSGSGGGGSGSDDEGGGGGSGSRKWKKKRRHRHRERSGSAEDIDEEDMELLQENLGIKITKKRKRIKMDSGSEDDEGSHDGRRELDDSREDDGDLPDPEHAAAEADGGDGYESEDVNDFIVDEDGQPIKRDRKKKKTHIFQDSQRQMAEDIFGVAFDYDEFEQYGEEEYESDEDDEDDDDEEGVERPAKKKRQKKKQTKTIFDIFEPRELELRHFTDQDNEIRNTDVPERMQLRHVPVTAVPEGSDELDREAEWIFKHGFTKPTVSKQDGYTRDECQEWARNQGTQEKIKKALDFMRQQFHEVPFIAFYRKEYVLPELKINDLWRVYQMDELWCKLQSRKKNLRKLWEKMQLYQVIKALIILCHTLDWAQ